MALKEELGDQAADNILCPKYIFNEDLKTYIEDVIPPSSMYKAVGYNDLNRVKLMMEGDDAEKREGSKRLSDLGWNDSEIESDLDQNPILENTHEEGVVVTEFHVRTLWHLLLQAWLRSLIAGANSILINLCKIFRFLFFICVPKDLFT